MPKCTEQQFKDFFKARAYDIIGEGSSRKNLNIRKDAGDPWAVQMAAGIHAVLTDVRHINSTIQQLTQSFPRLGEICKNVIIAAQPPIRIQGVQAVCAITQQKCNNCLCLPSGTKNQPIHVHMCFSRFFLFIWFICKIEYVIRCYVRCWLQTQETKTDKQQSYQKLAENIDSMEKNMAELYAFFVMSSDHILLSISNLMQSQSQPVIKN